MIRHPPERARNLRTRQRAKELGRGVRQCAHKAVAHAEAMAAAAGRKLGPVCSLTDNTQPTSLQDGQGFNNAALPASGATALPLEPGTQIESDEVTMVYALGR